MRPQKFTDVPSTRKPSSLRLRLQAGADEPRPNVGEIQKTHPNPAQPCANSSKRCIKRVSSLTGANNEAEILELRATISRQDIVTNLTPKVSASLSLRHFSLRNAKMLTLTMSLKAGAETLYLEVWTGRNTLGPKPRGDRIVQPSRPTQASGSSPCSRSGGGRRQSRSAGR
jgi:hypothetical protein